MFAYAISNNDMVYLYWHVPSKIPDCLGFSVVRHDQVTGKSEPLPAMVGFPTTKEASHKFDTTDNWPVQKFAWKDLFAVRGKTYWYEIVPMLGKPNNLHPDPARTMRTNSVTLSEKRGNCSVFFNRGIISTQAVARYITRKNHGVLSEGVLKKAVQRPDDPIRLRLAGDLIRGVLTLLKRARKEGGECYGALYELHDGELLQALQDLGGDSKSSLHLVLSNAGEDTEDGEGDGDSTNVEARKELHRLKLDVTDRFLKKNHIGHNKFMVYCDKEGRPRAVLSGSTNWTSTGLCAQSNNAIIIESPDLAGDYLNYWKALKKDTTQADGDGSALQETTFRDENKKLPREHILTNDHGEPSGQIHVWFSPNTSQKAVPRRKKDGKAVPPPTPPDLNEVFELIENARQGVLFLAFIPGNPSIVTKLREVYDARRRAHQLFYLRGAATSPDPASCFRVELYHRSSTSDASVRGVQAPPDAPGPSAKVSSVAGIFAAFAQWEAELYKIGHAVIHDKIIVIDPFTDASVVVTGSHNLGYKASYANDENLLIIRNDRAVAEAYAAHVLDVYEHYRWRWRIQQPIRDKFQKLKEANLRFKSGELWKEAVKRVGPVVIKGAWHSLVPDDSWQDFYEEHREFLAAEVNFWSPFGGVALAEDRPTDPVTMRNHLLR
jgi:phosphatidylserine/phosphatidylglycerophosphate/cardiolipin synthase-like enzyme